MKAVEIRNMSRNHYSNWEILSHLESKGYNRETAIRLIVTALHLLDDEIADMIDSYENNV
jgi:hypothetical protein